jgi:hypothetical protein
LAHDALELLLPALADRHEVHDGVAAADRAAQARGIGHVAVDELAAPGLELFASASVADEAPHRLVPRSQRVHDLRPDEARCAGDEDHRRAPSSRKFCQ